MEVPVQVNGLGASALSKSWFQCATVGGLLKGSMAVATPVMFASKRVPSSNSIEIGFEKLPHFEALALAARSSQCVPDRMKLKPYSVPTIVIMIPASSHSYRQYNPGKDTFISPCPHFEWSETQCVDNKNI